MGNLRKKNILWLSLAIPLFFSVATLQVGAQTTVLSVDPKFSSSRAPESEFTIRVSLDQVNDLAGFEFKLFWKRTVVNVTDASYTAPAQSWTDPVWLPSSSDERLNNEYNATHGRFFLGCFNLPITPISGNFILATLTFKVMSLGNCTLDLRETELTDSEANVISHETIDGEVTTLKISSISIFVSEDAIKVGESTTISGDINPNRDGANVTIHYRLTGEVAWNTTTVTTGSDGGYLYAWTPDEAGPYEVYASWPGDAWTTPAESDVVTVTVEGAPAPPYILYAAIVIVIVIVAAIAIYFLKIRKP